MIGPPTGSAHNDDIPVSYPQAWPGSSPYDEPTVAHGRQLAGTPHAVWDPLTPSHNLPSPPLGGVAPQPSRPPRRRWPAVAAIVAAVGVGVAASCVLVHQVSSPTSEPAPMSLPATYRAPRPIVTTPKPEPEPNAIHAGQLGRILGLGAGSGDVSISTVLGVEYLGKTAEFFGLSNWSSDRPDCGGVLLPSLPQGYDNSGFIDTRTHVHDGAKPGETDSRMMAEQQATTFYTTTAAADFVTMAVTKWGKCANQVVTVNKPKSSENPREPYIVGEPAMVDGILTVTATRQGPPEDPWQCQHSLTSRRNVVIDVAICAPTGSTQAPLLARWSADRVPQ